MSDLILASGSMPDDMRRRFEKEVGGEFDILYLPPDPALADRLAGAG